MWAGKTTELAKYIRSAYNPIAFDCCNTRNTNRDLHNITTTTSLSNIVNYKELRHDVVVFDEVHLADVFGHKEEIMNHLNNLLSEMEQSTVVLCGLLYDYFKQYEWFDIWHEIEHAYAKYIDRRIWLQSRIPCCSCNRIDSSVIYTKKLDNVQSIDSRVGDNYSNICMLCAWEEMTRRR